MAWLRIDDSVPGHPKHLKAGPSACWLWVCGIAYCQHHLSDGFIPDEALPLLGVRHGLPRLLKALADVHLFERVEGGYQVHDYLDHNASRDAAIAWKADTHEAKVRAGRAGARRRWQKHSRQIAGGDSTPIAAENGTSIAPSPPIPSHVERETSLSDRARDPFTDPTITERAGRFVDRYQGLYQKHRKGARYTLKPTRDYAAAVTLCQTWPDDRLDKLAVIFLTTDNKFAEEGSRTIPQFLALASWCDGRLAEHEHGKVGAA